MKKPEYAENLAKLENFVMVKHTKDTMVEPRESEHFEFYAPNQVFCYFLHSKCHIIGLKPVKL